MSARPRFHVWALLLAALALLAACGGAPAAPAPTAAPEPTPKPTLTPRPSPRPAPTSAPTDAPEPTSMPEPTAGAQLQDVEVGALETYTHSRELFSIDAPASWTRKDNSNDNEAIVTWTDPAENAFMQVDIFEQAQQQTNAELASFLKNYLEKTFSSQPDFTQDEAKESGPSMLIVWGYTGEGTGGIKAPLLGNSFIKQVGDKLSLFTLVVPEQQFDALQGSLNDILGSYKINQSVAIKAADPAGDALKVEIGELKTYNHASGLFSIDAPSNWAVTDNSKPGEAILMWSEPNGNATMVADVFAAQQNQTTDELTAFLKQFLTKTFGKQDQFSIDEPSPQKDGSVLLVWTYTDKQSGQPIPVLGNSFIEQHGDKVSILSTAVPAAQFDQLVDQLNTIIQSYSIDETAALP